MEPIKYRKKPVVIEAIHLTVDNVDEVAKWCGGKTVREEKPGDPSDVYTALLIPTLEGAMTGETHSGGDYIIRGVQGEFYPCKPGIFEATYEEAV